MQKKIANVDKYPSAPVKMILHPDWDVLSALYRELQWYPNRPTMTWIASHQDDNKKKAKLRLEAQLNVHADELVTIGLHRLGPKQHVPLDTDSKVQLNYQGMTLTRNLKKNVRELIQLQDLKAYYCRRFEWTSDIFETIDWEIFSPVYNRQAKQGLQFANKYGIKNLPTGERMRRRCGNEDERCCSYGQRIETDDHLFNVPAEKSTGEKSLEL